jgi:tetratricopeptide (TPR) repeat protein
MEIAGSLQVLSALARTQGELEESERLTRQALAIREEIGTRRAVGWNLWSLGWVLFLRGEFEEAVQVLDESRTILIDVGLGASDCHTWMGAAETHLGRYGSARTHTELGLAVRREFGIPQRVAYALMVLSWIDLAEGAYEKAEERLEESVGLYQQVTQPDEGSWALASMAYAERELGQRDQAWRHLREALRTGVEIRAFFPLVLGVPLAALLLADEGEAERAVEVYALASAQPFVAHSVWFEGVVGQHISAAAKGLPPQVVAAAQERGRTRDLWEMAEELLDELGEAPATMED